MKKLMELFQIPENKSFGKVFAPILFLIAIVAAMTENQIVAGILFLVGIFVVVATFYFPRLLFPLNLAWMSLGYLIGLVARPIGFGLVFFVVLSPIAILGKAVGRDELNLSSKLHSQWNDPNSYYTKSTFFEQY